MVVIPDGNFRMQSGDKISFIAPHKDSADFFKKAGIGTSTIKSVMIVGGGRLAYYLAKTLSDTRMKIKIIDRDERRCRELSELLPGAMIIPRGWHGPETPSGGGNRIGGGVRLPHGGGRGETS